MYENGTGVAQDYVHGTVCGSAGSGCESQQRCLGKGVYSLAISATSMSYWTLELLSTSRLILTPLRMYNVASFRISKPKA